ncbi:MAG: adenylate/guanylate cyclase domain-containing protein, partial [Mesorhizobium sp.]
CSSAEDRQILIDYSVARHLHDKIPIVDLGTRQLKGLDGLVRVFDVETKDRPDLAPNPNGVAAPG